jgi:hypothetical protein
MLGVLLSVSLASCVSTGSGKVLIATKAPKKVLDSKIKELCNTPVLLPERELSQQETEAYWGTDRWSLMDCYNKQKARNEVDR